MDKTGELGRVGTRDAGAKRGTQKPYYGVKKIMDTSTITDVLQVMAMSLLFYTLGKLQVDILRGLFKTIFTPRQ